MNRLRNLISLANLSKPRVGGPFPLRDARGQIATVLLLAIVAVLIFVLVTANLGNLSLTTTRVANAADSSALLLGSQLATKARVLWESLGRKTQKCTKGGFGLLGAILAIVVAVVAIVLQQYYVLPVLGFAAGSTGAMVAAGAIGGAVGGALGGGIQGGGMGALLGGAQGALIGGSIGYGVGTFGGVGSVAGSGGAGAGTSSAAIGATTEAEALSIVAMEEAALGVGGAAGAGPTAVSAPAGTLLGGAAGDTVFLAAATSIPASATVAFGPTSTLIASVPGAIGGGALSASSNLASAVIQEQLRGDAFAAAAKALSGLPEYDRFRDNSVFQALIQTVDDPNKITDAEDSDEDGDTKEQVPAFQVWWARRTNKIKGVVENYLKPYTQNFLNGPLATFENAAKATYTASGPLSRQEIEGADGTVVELARTLENKGFDLAFWKPGPAKAALEAWQALDCATCPPPAGFDDVDFAVDTSQDLVEISSGLREKPIESVVGTWQTWIKLFDDPAPDSQEDFYDLFNVLITGKDDVKGLNAWKTEIEDIRKGLPKCTYNETCDTGGVCVITSVQNPPCKGDGTAASLPLSGGSIDTDLADEFTPVQQQIGTLIGDIQTFRDASQQFHDNMKAAEALVAAQGGGTTYAWTDSRGPHSVKVEVGPFRIAYIKKKKSGGFLKKKICLILMDYSDGGGNTWVKLTRQDPSREAGFWTWNPHGGTITKMSRVSYSFDQVPSVAGIQ